MNMHSGGHWPGVSGFEGSCYHDTHANIRSSDGEMDGILFTLGGAIEQGACISDYSQA